MTARPPDQRRYYWARPDRRIVVGRFYIGARAVLRKLATWEEAGVVGTVPSGPLKGQPVFASEQAKRAGARLLRARWNEINKTVGTERAQAAAGPTLKAAWETWIAVSADKAPGTLAYYRRTLEEYLAAQRDHPARDFSLRHVDTFRAYLSGKGLAPASINIRLQNLVTFQGWAAERGYLPGTVRIRQLPKERRLPRVPDHAKVLALLRRLAWLRRRGSRDARARTHLHERAVRVLLGTGLRRSEVFWLRWADVDLDAGDLTVRYSEGFKVKERREKVVPLPPSLSAWLVRVRARASAQEVWLLDDGTGRHAFSTPGNLTRVLGRHFAAVGLAGLGIKAVHGFRAYYADRLHNQLGVPLEVVQRMMGHQSITTTMGYLPVVRTQERRAAALLDSVTRTLPGQGRGREAAKTKARDGASDGV